MKTQDYNKASARLQAFSRIASKYVRNIKNPRVFALESTQTIENWRYLSFSEFKITI
jgi:hypothetical protein